MFTDSVSATEQYLANQIMKGKLDYNKVISKFPAFMEGIDKILKRNNVLEQYKK